MLQFATSCGAVTEGELQEENWTANHFMPLLPLVDSNAAVIEVESGFEDYDHFNITDVSDLTFFMDRFPCLLKLLPAGVTKGTVLDEFVDYQGDSVSQVTSDPQFEAERIGVSWLRIGKLKDALGSLVSVT